MNPWTTTRYFVLWRMRTAGFCELCLGLDITRQAVAKHLAILEDANLVSWKRQGREKLHFINPVPINEIAERWIGKFEQPRLAALSDLKKSLEGDEHD
jgi:DNA-binding transcriptional ArsR family regulator